MRANLLTTTLSFVREPLRKRALRHFGYFCAASLYLAFGAMLYVLATWLTGQAVEWLEFLDWNQLALALYLPALVLWIALLPSFASLAAAEIYKQQ